MAKSVYATDLKSVVERHAGSTPASRTTQPTIEWAFDLMKTNSRFVLIDCKAKKATVYDGKVPLENATYEIQGPVSSAEIEEIRVTNYPTKA